MILFIVSFLAGVLTILAPCTLPLLPVIVGSSVTGERRGLKKAFVIAASLGVSVIIFTLLLKSSTLLINVSASTWAVVSGTIIIIFGLVSLFPGLWERIPFVGKLNRSSNKLLATGYKKQGFWGDVIIGASLGPVFTTCSPTYFIILATVLPQSFFLGFIYLAAYAVGLAGVLLLVAYAGQKLISRLGAVSDGHGWFKRGLGILFILIGIAVISGVDKKIETALLNSGIFDITKVEQKLLELNESGKGKDERGIPAPEIVNPSGFINTDGEPITLEQFQGKKVVLLDIWTYSCINCQRTIPYLKAWDEKYRDLGLVIVGLHTPEFAFEKVQANVEAAVKGFGIEYPVVLDNDYETWNAYDNQYWPRKYLIDENGNIIYDHIGEGDYAETERAIQKALVKLNMSLGNTVIVPTDMVDPANAVEVNRVRVKSPEVYFGAARNEFLANGRPNMLGVQNLALPDAFIKNNLYLGGSWNMGAEEARSESPAKIVFIYNAAKVYMVASSKAEKGIDVVIYKDGVEVKTINIKENKLYNLIEGNDYGEHLLEVDIPEAGLDAFTFTFG